MRNKKKRFQLRIDDPTKRWKLSPMDLESCEKWLEYSKAKDEVFKYTDTKQCPWFVIPADNKKRARLNCISHLIGLIPYQIIEHEKEVLPSRKKEEGYIRPPLSDQTFVPEKF